METACRGAYPQIGLGLRWFPSISEIMARRRDGKQPWNMRVTWAICITWVTWHESEYMKSHEVGRVFLDVTADHSGQCGVIYLAVWLCKCCFLHFPALFPYVALRSLSRGVNTEPLPQRHAHALAKCWFFESPSESIRVHESWWNESPSPVTCRTLAVSVVFQLS